MSWSSRRRFSYLSGTLLFLAVVVGVPLFLWLYQGPTCFDGTQNQGETAVDKGGPCQLLDERTLVPHAVEWSRGFSVRDGSYNAVAYIENPNEFAGVRSAPYRFKLYDANNILVAEREGVTYIMPAGVTAVFEGAIDTGNRQVQRTYFEFSGPLVWERLENVSRAVRVTNRSLTNAETESRISAEVENTSVADMKDLMFVVVAFDPAGNAIAVSRTLVPTLMGGERRTITFTWPDPLPQSVGRIDITPLRAPVPVRELQ